MRKLSKFLLLAFLPAIVGCGSVDSIQDVSAVQQRNAHTYVMDVSYLPKIILYAKLPTCSETVTAKCKSLDYLNNTIVPAKEAEQKALLNLKTSIGNNTVTDTIQKEENNDFDALSAIVSGDVLKSALGE